jgi:hypothetical protein
MNCSSKWCSKIHGGAQLTNGTRVCSKVLAANLVLYIHAYTTRKEKISKETQGMSFEEFKEYLNKRKLKTVK